MAAWDGLRSAPTTTPFGRGWLRGKAPSAGTFATLREGEPRSGGIQEALTRQPSEEATPTSSHAESSVACLL